MRLPHLDREHLDFFIVEQRLVEDERSRFLAKRPERLDIGGPWRAIRGMGMTGTHDIGSRRQQRSVDVVSGRIHRTGRVAVFAHDTAIGTD